MKDKERDEILYRLDERTKKVDDTLNRIEERVSNNEKAIQAMDDRIQSNEDDLSKAKWAIGALLTLFSGALAKVMKIF